MKLTFHEYGKQRVRVLKIIRDGDLHTVKELTIGVALQGDFDTSYTSGDNSLVVATDTMKNTVHALAREHLGTETERFLIYLGNRFLGKYPQVTEATITATERSWDRLEIAGKPHPHSFSTNDSTHPFSEVVMTRESRMVHSGIDNLLILKSTQAGFVGYPRDEFTTLPETTDRILATSLTATWKWTQEPADYGVANGNILKVMLDVFATNYSPSAQTTLFQMGSAALETCPEIGEIHIAMPNKHYLTIPLERFGIANNNEIFLPTDEPHGQIEATVAR